MAIDLMSRIPDRDDLDSSEKLVLMIMADRADEEGLLWYANATIARKCSMTVRGVQKVMDRLIGKQIVRKMHRHDRSNFYIINVDALPHVAKPAKPAKERGPIDYLEEEPDLFGRGEQGSSRGERRSIRGERGSDRGEPGSPDSLSDSRNDSQSPYAREIATFFEEQWNEKLADRFPKIASIQMTDRRRPKLMERLRETVPKPQGSENEVDRATIRAICDKIAGSPFLCGEVKNWAITVDWVLGPENWLKTMERQNERVTDGPTGNGRSNLASGRNALELHRARHGKSGGASGAPR